MDSSLQQERGVDNGNHCDAMPSRAGPGSLPHGSCMTTAQLKQLEGLFLKRCRGTRRTWRSSMARTRQQRDAVSPAALFEPMATPEEILRTKSDSGCEGLTATASGTQHAARLLLRSHHVTGYETATEAKQVIPDPICTVISSLSAPADLELGASAAKAALEPRAGHEPGAESAAQYSEPGMSKSPRKSQRTVSRSFMHQRGHSAHMHDGSRRASTSGPMQQPRNSFDKFARARCSFDSTRSSFSARPSMDPIPEHSIAYDDAVVSFQNPLFERHSLDAMSGTSERTSFESAVSSIVSSQASLDAALEADMQQDALTACSRNAAAAFLVQSQRRPGMKEEVGDLAEALARELDIIIEGVASKPYVQDAVNAYIESSQDVKARIESITRTLWPTYALRATPEQSPQLIAGLQEQRQLALSPDVPLSAPVSFTHVVRPCTIAVGATLAQPEEQLMLSRGRYSDEIQEDVFEGNPRVADTLMPRLDALDNLNLLQTVGDSVFDAGAAGVQRSRRLVRGLRFMTAQVAGALMGTLHWVTWPVCTVARRLGHFADGRLSAIADRVAPSLDLRIAA